MFNIFIFFLTLIYTANSLYLYDRFQNRGTTSYNFGDTGNIFYASSNFHSLEYVNKNNTKISLRTKSLPNIKFNSTCKLYIKR
jgi:hypothetical protein